MISRPLIKKDLRMLFRDPIMFLIVMIPFILTLVTFLFYRFDPLAYLPFDLDPGFILTVLRKTLPLFGGLMGGWITGFCLLEEKENELEPQLNVSPLSPRDRMMTRLTTTFLTGLAVNMLLLIGDRLIYHDKGGSVILFAGASLTGPLAMAIMARWGKNRVQGLTLAKLSSLILIPPLLILILPSPPFVPLLLLSPLTGLFSEGFSGQAAGIILLFAYTALLIRRTGK